MAPWWPPYEATEVGADPVEKAEETAEGDLHTDPIENPTPKKLSAADLLKNFHGDMEDDNSVIKRQAIATRIAYKKRIGVRKLKPERQNKHIERTQISKVSTQTVRRDTYLVIEEQKKQFQKGVLKEMTLDKLMEKFKQRKVGERMIRVSSPLASFRPDDIPSPLAKNYDMQNRAPMLTNQQKSDDKAPMTLAEFKEIKM